MGGEQDDRQTRALRVQAAQELDPVHLRHLPVGHDRVGAARLERGEGVLAARAALALPPGAPERGGDDTDHPLLVVDDEDARSHAALATSIEGLTPPSPPRSRSAAE